MSLFLENPSADLGDRLREACAVTAEFMSDIVRQACRRFPSLRHSAKTERIERLIQSGAWTDAALALIDLELALAILSALVEAQRVDAPPSRTSVPMVPQDANPLYEPVYSDNFA